MTNIFQMGRSTTNQLMLIAFAAATQGIAGNIGFVMFTCVGGDPRSFVREACSFMKAKNPKLADDSDIEPDFP